MAQAIADDESRILAADVARKVREALRCLQAIATTGHDDLDADLLVAEQALRRVKSGIESR